MSTILVTGGAGFIGLNLVRSYLSKGDDVIVLDNLITSASQFIEELSKNPHVTYIRHNIVDPLPESLLKRHIDIIYHLACPTGVSNLIRLGEEMLLTCSIGTRSVLELARETNAVVVLASSSEVYGNPIISPQSEEYTGNVSPLGERSAYEEGKRFSESLALLYVRKYGVRVMIARIFNTYGPYMSLSDTRVIPQFIRKMKDGQPLLVYGTGEQSRTFCFVDDLVWGLKLLSKKGIPGEAYNIGSTENMTISDLAQLMLSLAQKNDAVLFEKRPSHDHENRMPDLRKIQSLGWKQETPLKEGLQWTMHWYGL